MKCSYAEMKAIDGNPFIDTVEERHEIQFRGYFKWAEAETNDAQVR